MENKDEFLQGCMNGWLDAMKENAEWVDKTKAQKKGFAKDAIAEFEKHYFMLNTIYKMNQYSQ